MPAFVITRPGFYLTRGGLVAEVFPEFDWIVSGMVNGQRMQWFRDDGYSLSNDKALDLVSMTPQPGAPRLGRRLA